MTIYLPDECTACGMCCTNHLDPKWVEVTLADSVSLPKDALTGGDIAVFAMVQDKTGRCCKLVGEIGKSCKCVVYESRPSICRQVERGDSTCLSSIQRFRGNMEKSHG